MSNKEANFAYMFSLSGGRTATLSVLYNLNSRDSLVQHSRCTSAAATSIYMDTTVEPGRMFRGRVESWSAGKDQKPDERSWTGIVAQDASYDGSYGSDSRFRLETRGSVRESYT